MAAEDSSNSVVPETEKLPSGPVPPMEELKQEIYSIIDDVGPSSLTMKILLKRLAHHFHVDLTSIKHEIDDIVITKLTEATKERELTRQAVQRKKDRDREERAGEQKGKKHKKEKKHSERRERKEKRERAEGQPKKPQSAFFLFLSAQREQIKKDLEEASPGTKIGPTDIGKKAGELWGALSAEAKAPYESKQVEAKAEYEEAMKKWEAEGGQKVKTHKKEKVESNIKKPMSAYFFFTGKKRLDVINESPGMKVTEVGKKLGEMWREMSAEEKAPYEEMAAKDRQRYEAEKNGTAPPKATEAGGDGWLKNQSSESSSSSSDDDDGEEPSPSN